MHSISTHNSDVEYFVFVDSAFSEENRKRLQDIATQYGSSITIKIITPEDTEAMPVGRSDQPGYITKSAYNRLFAATLLPESLEKVIYLDSDIVVRKSLRAMWETDIEGCAVGVVNDMAEQNHIESGRLPYDMTSDGYFNSGVLLINLKYWREHDCMKQFCDIVEQHQEALTLHDQDVLNIAFHDKKQWLPVTYNFQNGFILNDSQFRVVDSVKGDIEASKHNPAIVHFSTWDKPWKLECFHPYCKDWRKHYFRSVWHKDRLQDEHPHSLKDRFRNYLVKHCWYVPASLYKL